MVGCHEERFPDDTSLSMSLSLSLSSTISLRPKHPVCLPQHRPSRSSLPVTFLLLLVCKLPPSISSSLRIFKLTPNLRPISLSNHQPRTTNHEPPTIHYEDRPSPHTKMPTNQPPQPSTPPPPPSPSPSPPTVRPNPLGQNPPTPPRARTPSPPPAPEPGPST